jgi:transposase-like protein
MGYDQATRGLAVRLYLEGNSFRAIGRLLSVNYVSVINWVNAVHATLPQEVADTNHTEIEEADELCTFVGKKTNKSM